MCDVDGVGVVYRAVGAVLLCTSYVFGIGPACSQARLWYIHAALVILGAAIATRHPQTVDSS